MLKQKIQQQNVTSVNIELGLLDRLSTHGSEGRALEPNGSGAEFNAHRRNILLLDFLSSRSKAYDDYY